MKFPKLIFVQVGGTKDAEYLHASANETEAMETDLDERVAGERVALYELVEVVKLAESRTYTRTKIK